ncbi:MAG TPA: hypothetical protein VFC90_05990, partial [Planctomycetota bacterium]|nr:hypothetical protein [Planctomycetota bacterium]
MTFLEFLRERIERGAISTEDTLASVLPLVRQTLDVHDAGRVAPFRGVEHLKVEGFRLWFEAAKSPERQLSARLRDFEKPQSVSLEIFGKGELTDSIT